jgi:hypothetical protein
VVDAGKDGRLGRQLVFHLHGFLLGAAGIQPPFIIEQPAYLSRLFYLDSFNIRESVTTYNSVMLYINFPRFTALLWPHISAFFGKFNNPRSPVVPYGKPSLQIRC